MFSKLLWGILARIISFFVPVHKDEWIFGADYGNSYREGSKYLIEYIIKNHPEIKCTFFTKNKEVIRELNNKGIPVLNNNSFSGLFSIAKAECVFTCQYLGDINYSFKKKGRRYFYVLHGMPYKLAADALPKNVISEPIGLITNIKKIISRYLISGYDINDVEFLSVTSDFLVPYELKDHSNKIPVKVLGMPRNDALFNVERMKGEKWIEGIDGKFIITYMPTHRTYGIGELSPKPFENRQDVQKWMEDNNVVLLVKQHPNMIPKLKNIEDLPTIKDITKLRLDPQVCIYHSDCLITDYSSVWMDYLLLCRPLVFYYYDNFEEEDAGTHYSIKDVKPGHFCYSEDELFDIIRGIVSNYELMKPSNEVVAQFHKYCDGDSCERYYREIKKIDMGIRLFKEYKSIIVFIIIGLMFSPLSTNFFLNTLHSPIVVPEVIYIPILLLFYKKLGISLKYKCNFAPYFLIWLFLLLLALLINRWSPMAILSTSRSFLILGMFYVIGKSIEVNSGLVKKLLLISVISLIGWGASTFMNFRSLEYNTEESVCYGNMIAIAYSFAILLLYIKNRPILGVVFFLNVLLSFTTALRRQIIVTVLSAVASLSLITLRKKQFGNLIAVLVFLLPVYIMMPKIEEQIYEVNPYLHYRIFNRTAQVASGDVQGGDKSRMNRQLYIFTRFDELAIPHGYVSQQTGKDKDAGEFNDIPTYMLAYTFSAPLVIIYIVLYLLRLLSALKTYIKYSNDYYGIIFVIGLVMLFLHFVESSMFIYTYTVPLTGISLGLLFRKDNISI